MVCGCFEAILFAVGEGECGVDVPVGEGVAGVEGGRLDAPHRRYYYMCEWGGQK